MRYNGTCTIWHKDGDSYNASFYQCWWQDTKSVNISKSGSTNADTAKIYLPVNAVVEKSDYIASGTIDFSFDSVSELLKAHSPLKISSVSCKAYGSKRMRHTEVTAK